MSNIVVTLTDTSPAAASTVIGSTVAGLLIWRKFTVDAEIIGGTGGTIDLILQKQVTTDVWADWLRLPQVAAATTARYSVAVESTGTIVPVTWGTDAAHGTPVLATNTCVGGHPGNRVRAVYIAGAGTSAGATQTVHITASR